MTDQVREQVRLRYAAAATAVATTGRDALGVVDADQARVPAAEADSCCAPTEVDAAFGSSLYSADEQGELPADAVAASLGCGNPMAVADLRTGEKVLDLGCGEGNLLKLLLREAQFEHVLGMDVSARALERAKANLRLGELPEALRARLTLIQGSLTYRDARLAGYDAAALVEVIEHLDEPRLWTLERVVFGHARPGTVVVNRMPSRCTFSAIG